MTLQLHQRPRSEASKSDEYETPLSVYQSLCKEYKMKPLLDVCATSKNKKCPSYFNKKDNAIEKEWVFDSWGNIPQTKAQKFIIKADQQSKKHNINIILITAINSTVTKAGKKLLWNKSNPTIYPLLPTPVFLVNGKPLLDKNGKPQGARNRYCVLIWRKRK